MSDQFQFTLTFQTRPDMPTPLQAVLTALSARQKPQQSDLQTLPEIVASYLDLDYATVPGSTARYSCRFTPLPDFLNSGPKAATHFLHLERRFHDDEFFNGGIYFVYWLFQFSAHDGLLAVETNKIDWLPVIYTRAGDDILVSRLGYNPDELWPSPQALDPDNPIVVLSTTRVPLAGIVEDAANWSFKDPFA